QSVPVADKDMFAVRQEGERERLELGFLETPALLARGHVPEAKGFGKMMAKLGSAIKFVEGEQRLAVGRESGGINFHGPFVPALRPRAVRSKAWDNVVFAPFARGILVNLAPCRLGRRPGP